MTWRKWTISQPTRVVPTFYRNFFDIFDLDDGNPMKKLELLQEQGQYLSAIMNRGPFHNKKL